VLVFVDLAGGAQRLGGSALAQTFAQYGGVPPDVDDVQRLKRWFAVQRELREAGLLLAYHDRSDGGLFTALVEMAFAANVGLDVELDASAADAVAYLFNEELGAVVQVPAADYERVAKLLAAQRVPHHAIARIAQHDDVVVRRAGSELYRAPRVELRRKWSELTFRMQALRDDPQCAREAFDAVLDAKDPGLATKLTFPLPTERRAGARAGRPKVAVLREQGVNGQREMAATLDRAGFEAHDVHMTDLLSGRKGLEDYRGAIACGGFSYGDVLGAGEGWAKTILYHERARPMFEEFFARSDAFALGVCNGCQMLAALKELIPGTQSWPKFLRNRSDQFEARLTLVEIVPSPSVLLAGMAGSRIPIVTAHGEGRAEFASPNDLATCDSQLTAMRFVKNGGGVANTYPANPNGSPNGIAGLSNADGRVTIMMPHPERVFRTVQMSWHPAEWGECSPWQRLFDNARTWVG
jgi:phosphoribosylformylglycinamidine synthase